MLAKNKGLSPHYIENIIVIAFILFGLFGILHHEMWRDELKAWMLARDSISLPDLYANMQYEGHPALWQLFLYGLSQITPNPVIMQVFHLLISVGNIWLIAKFSPFSILQKFLLSCSYFLLFEYTIISRSYNSGILLAFLFCAVYTGRRYRAWILTLLLALMANTSVYGLILSFAMSLLLFWGHSSQSKRSIRPVANPLGAFAAVAILGLGWLASVLQIIRPLVSQPDDTVASGATSAPAETAAATVNLSSLAVEHIQLIFRAVSDIWESHVPIPKLFELRFWNSNLLTDSSFLPTVGGFYVGDLLAFLFAIAIFCLIVYLLFPKPVVAWVYITGSLGIILFRYVTHAFVMKFVAARHYGHLFIITVICFWLFDAIVSSHSNSPSPEDRTARQRLKSVFLTGLFSVQAVAGIYALSMDFVYPFSEGRQAAAFIRSSQLSQLEMIGIHAQKASVISGYLNRPIYYPERQELGSFWALSKPEFKSAAEVAQGIEARVAQIPEEASLLILTEDFDLSGLTTLELDELARFDQSIEKDENFYLYRVQKPSS